MPLFVDFSKAPIAFVPRETDLIPLACIESHTFRRILFPAQCARHFGLLRPALAEFVAVVRFVAFVMSDRALAKPPRHISTLRASIFISTLRASIFSATTHRS
jgi:hypothetical protein